MSLFYLQDSRSYVGDGLQFWGKGGRGYVTDLDKAELFTAEQAVRHRDTDIPWPKDYIDARAHLGVDFQCLDMHAASQHLADGCMCVLQVPKQWNGNDIFFACYPIGSTDCLEKAHRLTLEEARAIGDDDLVIWPVAYIDTISRRLVHRQDVDIKEALRGTGIKLPKPERQRRPRELIFNCVGCGRFISDSQRFRHDCLNCGASNTP